MDFLCSLAETELCGIQICQRGQQNGFICNILREDYVFVFMEEYLSREKKIQCTHFNGLYIKNVMHAQRYAGYGI